MSTYLVVKLRNCNSMGFTVRSLCKVVDFCVNVLSCDKSPNPDVIVDAAAPPLVGSPAAAELIDRGSKSSLFVCTIVLTRRVDRCTQQSVGQQDEGWLFRNMSTPSDSCSANCTNLGTVLGTDASKA